MTTVVTRGAASAQALGYASSSAAVTYIEDVFSTYLYTGNGSTQTITNGIDLSGKGGLVWLKGRSSADENFLFDTSRTSALFTNNANAAGSGYVPTYFNFGASGFYVDASGANYNVNGNTYASWTFRKQPKFFDVVTYTGDGVAGRSIAHNLGSTPGCIIVKCTSLGATDWQVYHVGLGAMPKRIVLNSTNAADSSDHFYATPTSSVFYVNNYQSVNQNAATYVAYLFAHNAGGFGLTGTDNVISCGSYTGNGTSENNVTLGYEPQWVLIKDTTTAYKWLLMDNMRGFQMGTSSAVLSPNSSDAETANGAIQPSATGFTLTSGGGFLNGSGDNYIYIAIRRGPMKVPTSGTQVYLPLTRTGNGAVTNVTGVGFPPDLLISGRNAVSSYRCFQDRLRGPNIVLPSGDTSAESADTDSLRSFNMDGVTVGLNNGGFASTNSNGFSYINWFFRRAPGFFDVVCYTGTGVARTVTHNLAAVPELIIVKSRNQISNWMVYHVALGNTKAAYLDSSTTPYTSSVWWNNTTPTSAVYTVGTDSYVNGSGDTYVAYLFATVAGVSKVGSYTGTGTTQTINCGFTAGARFVLIKRTDSTGDWYVWDSARGIVAGNDPFLLLNSTAAEVTNTDYVDTAASGFEISSTAPAAINANGGSFIFLAIA